MTATQIQPQSALLLVDVQKDFCPGGALPVVECHAMLEVLNRWIATAVRSGAPVIASRDWHPPDHVSFVVRGGPWPVHCVQGTEGAGFCQQLRLPADVHVVSKGVDRDRESYSAFDGTGLQQWLRERHVQHLWVGGVALEVCVRATALDALQNGFDVHLILAGTSPVDPAKGEQAVREMQATGVLVQ